MTGDTDESIFITPRDAHTPMCRLKPSSYLIPYHNFRRKCVIRRFHSWQFPRQAGKSHYQHLFCNLETITSKASLISHYHYTENMDNYLGKGILFNSMMSLKPPMRKVNQWLSILKTVFAISALITVRVITLPTAICSFSSLHLIC